MFTISFDFDETTKKIKNIKVVSIETESPTLRVLDNKLELSSEALKLMGVKPEDRLTITYWTVNNEKTFPVIGKAEVFTDKTDGQRLTKSNTISFRGQQRTVLLEYGSFFTIELFKNNMFKLVPVNLETGTMEEDLPF